MVVPCPASGYKDYRRLWRRAVRTELCSTAVALALAAPGLAAGLWLTDGWESRWAATQVTGLGAVAAVVVGYLGWRMVGRMRGRPWRRPTSPQMLRAVWRGEVGLVTPPHRAPAAGLIVVLVGVVAWLVVATVAVRAGVLRPDRVQVLLPVAALAASNLVGLLGNRLGPRVALLADRIEIRRGLGRYLVPWSTVAAVGEQGGRVVVYLRQAGSATRQGWIRRHPTYGVLISASGTPGDVLVNTIERYRRDPAALGRLTSPAQPPDNRPAPAA